MNVSCNASMIGIAVHSLQRWRIKQVWPIEQSPEGGDQVLQELGNCQE